MNTNQSIQQGIRSHLNKTKEEFNNHLSGRGKSFLFEIALKSSERQEKVKKILNWINEALGDEVLDRDEKDALKEYKVLYDKWNENQKDYDGSLDFGGRLLTLKNLLETKPQGGGLTESEKNIIKLLPQMILTINNFLVLSDKDSITLAEELLAKFNENDLTIKANPNLNEGITKERRSNTRQFASSFKQIIEACKKMN